ncbi:hypothetical protein V8C40DRAFT_285718 [Trichoderma camerunense]
MATLDTLKQTLRQTARATASYAAQPLSQLQYSAGFDVLVQGSGWMTYQDFIVPQLSSLLERLFNSRVHISVLEIGPGPKSVLGYLPYHVRRRITRYVAFEPNDLFAVRLDEWFHPNSGTECPLPCLELRPDIHRIPFAPDNDNKNTRSSTSIGTSDDGKFDVVLFCHSMYGMTPKRRFIEDALKLLCEHPEGGIVVVFHRDGDLNFDGLVCHHTASFPTGIVRIATDDETLDRFTSFIAGFTLQDEKMNEAIRGKWRELCHVLGRREEAYPDHLLFSSPNVMATFTKYATALPDLTAHVPLVTQSRRIKNHEARLHRPASIVRPTEIEHIQKCVKWALRENFSLTVIGGSHSGHCLQPNVVSIDMSAFNQVYMVTEEAEGAELNFNSNTLVVAEAGCNTGDIVRKTMVAGVTVPLGARPSVGSGLWLQGGVGHLARLYGLACDAIVGAVMVSVASGQVLYVGHVPSKYRPAGAVQPDIETDLLWALKGAGTNFGIVVSVVFKTYAARKYLFRNWRIPLKDDHDTRLKLQDFDQYARTLPRHSSADAYLFSDNSQMHLGMTVIESATTELPSKAPRLTGTMLGPEDFKTVDGVGLFETEMYISGMHGGHGRGKTSSFKRCLFLKHIGAMNIANALAAAIETRPSPLCYLHLLQGGGAVGDVADNATAFGCRDWEFACVITAVWPRNESGTKVTQAAIQWVYSVARSLLPLSSGVYSADLGPDPRDTALAAKAFGPNGPRLAQLKHSLDVQNVLAYACPLSKLPKKQKLIILVTGESGVGKDYCADVWVPMLARSADQPRQVHKASISDAIKREYAAATGADLDSLLGDRTYKEQHRPALTAFFKEQMRQQSWLLEKQFLNVVSGAADADVLVITGMRDEAPTATLSHLVPNSRLLDIRVTASEKTRQTRRKRQASDNDRHDNHDCEDDNSSDNGSNCKSNSTTLDYCPSLVFDNEATGDEVVRRFADTYLLPFLHGDLERLASMVLPVPDFPRPGIEFRHVLNIAQQRGGLALCTSLLQTCFVGDWDKIGIVACCEAGGFVYASALAQQVGVPLALIREAGKLPPPTVSVNKPSSHISSSEPNNLKGKRIEMSLDLIPRGASVVVVDDVLATGRTLYAILQLLAKAGISNKDISIIIIAEFPVHRGRELLYRRGFGGISVQSLLVFGGA